VEPLVLRARNVADIANALTDLSRTAGSGIIVLPDAFTIAHRVSLIQLAAVSHLPAIYGLRFFATDGGLISYGIDDADLYRRAASYVDRILKGAKPAELPVQQPNKFELVINLKCAKELGLTIPPPLLTRADEVIE
jgi:putative ABC transport system substrate-binding protein